jgi:hypothetical protein
MMIETRDLPQEYVSIRQVWLMQINRCTEALTNRYKIDITVDGSYRNVDNVGRMTVIESVLALYYSLVDYGEATVKTEARKKLNDFREKPDFRDNRTYYYKQFFEFIIETMNKYGMLFDTSPQGYTNTEMKSM